MTETCSTLTCDECHRPLMRIDFYGELLDGCLSCNRWTEAGGAIGTATGASWCIGSD